MLLKPLFFAVLLVLVQVVLSGKKVFMIKNMKSGLVLDGGQTIIRASPWNGQNCQRWRTIAASKPGYAFFQNVATGQVMHVGTTHKLIRTVPLQATVNQKWKIGPAGRMHVIEMPNQHLMYKDNRLQYGAVQHDGADQWIMVQVN